MRSFSEVLITGINTNWPRPRRCRTGFSTEQVFAIRARAIGGFLCDFKKSAASINCGELTHSIGNGFHRSDGDDKCERCKTEIIANDHLCYRCLSSGNRDFQYGGFWALNSLIADRKSPKLHDPFERKFRGTVQLE